MLYWDLTDKEERCSGTRYTIFRLPLQTRACSDNSESDTPEHPGIVSSKVENEKETDRISSCSPDREANSLKGDRSEHSEMEAPLSGSLSLYYSATPHMTQASVWESL